MSAFPTDFGSRPTIDNRPLLAGLMAAGRVAVEPTPLLDETPRPLPATFDFDRVEGMLLGLAIGDALGNTTEGLFPAERRQLHGEIRDYLPNPRVEGRAVGLPSDDSQMAFWTLEQLVADGGLVPDHLAARFCRQRIFGIGSAVQGFVAAYRAGTPWTEAGQGSAGNGALMRIAPILVPHLRRPTAALWADAVLAGMVTHADRASNACSVAFVRLLWECLGFDGPPEAEWWVETFCHTARALEGTSRYRPRVPGLDYAGPVAEFACSRVRAALEAETPVVEACDSWFSGAYLMETVPSVLYILARHGHDPEEAVVRAVNDTVDNDTIAAIVGAAAGALHGRRKLPERWQRSLLGRTAEADDAQVQRLIERARHVFWDVERMP